MKSYEFAPIGYINTCFPEKFGIPRQSLLSERAKGQLTLLPPFNNPDCIEGLEQSSHIWLSFIFHQHIEQGWKSKVRPPRMGGNKKVGVFATRSSFRPNHLGLSVVQLDRIDTNEGVTLHLSGVDLMDGTPIIDIKPYIPYADSITSASNTLASAPPEIIDVKFSNTAIVFCEEYQQQTTINLQALIVEVLAQQPQPAYKDNSTKREYGTRLYDCNIRWHIIKEKGQTSIEVSAIEQLTTSQID